MARGNGMIAAMKPSNAIAVFLAVFAALSAMADEPFVGFADDKVEVKDSGDTGSPPPADAPYRNPALDVEKRIDDLLPRLKACPNMIEYQTELNFDDGEGWAGMSPAPVGGYSIRRLVDVFRNRLGFDK